LDKGGLEGGRPGFVILLIDFVLIGTVVNSCSMDEFAKMSSIPSPPGPSPALGRGELMIQCFCSSLPRWGEGGRKYFFSVCAPKDREHAPDHVWRISDSQSSFE